MSVVVRGLIMPDGCEECKVSCETESGLHCLLVDDGNKWGWKKIESRERPDWCPLVELPQWHGRLIDADEFDADYEALYKLNNITNSEWILFREWLRNQKTIV